MPAPRAFLTTSSNHRFFATCHVPHKQNAPSLNESIRGLERGLSIMGGGRHFCRARERCKPTHPS